jgi:hypothetical protein
MYKEKFVKQQTNDQRNVFETAHADGFPSIENFKMQGKS